MTEVQIMETYFKEWSMKRDGIYTIVCINDSIHWVVDNQDRVYELVGDKMFWADIFNEDIRQSIVTEVSINDNTRVEINGLDLSEAIVAKIN